MIKNSLQDFKRFIQDYSELRLQENRRHSIILVNGNLVNNEKLAKSGISSRAYKSGFWGFASSPDVSRENIKKIIKTAENNAKFLALKRASDKKDFVNLNCEYKVDFSTKKTKISDKEKMNFLKEIDNHIQKKYPDVVNRKIVYGSLEMEKNLINSSGSLLYSHLPRTIINIFLGLDDTKGNPTELHKNWGGLGEFEDYFNKPDDLYEEIDLLYNHLKNKNQGIYADAGVKECILASDLAGILAHEAIGHTTEADIVLGGSVAMNYVGEEAVSPLITLVDFAHTALGKTCPMPIYIDDEGTKAEDVVIIENGILNGFMHNKESAKHFKVKPQGNARAYEFSDEPIIRMRNTAILPGKSKIDEMISSIEDGYYLLKSSNGQADTTSEFMFGVTMAYEIKNGKLGRAIKDTTISGVAFDVLKSVTMVSDDMSWSSAGMCGKKQLIPVGMGGPAIKCKINIGGR